MTETTTSVHPTVPVARDLSEIIDLYARLASQAENEASHSLMPGGQAMVALGGVANLEAWENRHQATERYRTAYTSVEDEDPDEAWSPFQLIEFWSERWRREHQAEYEGLRPTIASEASFVRWALDWAWRREPQWPRFVSDIRLARVRLENIVHAGKRVELSRIVCPDCESDPRLIVLRGSADDGSDDVLKCHVCRLRLTPEAAKKAHAKMLRSEGAERWVHQADAIATLRSMGRPERTVRAWLGEGEGSAYCDPETHEVWVWWPDLWRRHLATPTRQRSASA